MLSLDDMQKQFSSLQEVQEYTNNQFLTIRRLEEENNKLKGDLSKLKALILSKELTGSRVQVINASSEQIICETQIAKLHEISSMRPLSLEETKQFDVYVKNLLLIKNRDEKTLKAESETVALSDHELIAMVSNVVPE